MSSAGKANQRSGVREPSPKWMASFKRGVDDYARNKAASDANRKPNLVVTPREKGASK